MGTLFLNILNMSLSASWLIFAVILLRVVLKKVPKWINVLLWALVAVRLLCPISFESSLSLVPNPQPISQELFMVQPTANHVSPVFHPVENAKLQDVPTVSADAGMEQIQWKSVFGTIGWVFGIVAVLAYAMISYAVVRCKVKVSLHLRDNIWMCDEIQTPFILGIIKPRIYIPSGTDEAKLPHILAHENAHLRRRDHWCKPLGFVVLAVHWFNPLVWVAYSLLCRDIELACDEKVIREWNQTESVAYSEALLSCSVNRRMVMVCPLAFGEVGVKERVKRVLNYKKPGVWVVAVSVLACVVVAVCFLTNPAGTALTKWTIEEVDMNAALDDVQAMTVRYDGVSVSCSDAESNRIVATMNKIKVGQHSISRSRNHNRDHSFTITINDNLSLHFSFDFSELWVDNGVKPSLSYPVTNPETARELMLDFSFMNRGTEKQRIDYPENPEEMSKDGFLEKYVDMEELSVANFDAGKLSTFEDRTLILEDCIDNSLEQIVYQWYYYLCEPDFDRLGTLIGDEGALKLTIEAEKQQFNEGIYKTEYILHSMNTLSADHVGLLPEYIKDNISEKIDGYGLDKFAIVQTDVTWKHNEKSLSLGPQLGDGRYYRYYLLATKSGSSDFLLYEVYWEMYNELESRNED